MQTSTVMLRPTAFVRTMIDSATVRPFFTALLEMKRARRATRPVETASTIVAEVVLPTSRAA